MDEDRRRGAPEGNHNALKHGRYSAAAKAARMKERARLMQRLAATLKLKNAPALQRLIDARQPAADGPGLERALPNKRINSPPRGAPKRNRNALKTGRKSLILQEFLYDRSVMLAGLEAVPGDAARAIASPKQQTTSEPGARSPKGGAPKGNRNALKTGRYTAENKANKRRVVALIKRAHVVIADVDKRLPRRKPGPKPAPRRDAESPCEVPMQPLRGFRHRGAKSLADKVLPLDGSLESAKSERTGGWNRRRPSGGGQA